MHLPHFMRRVNRVITNPLMSTFAWVVPPLGMVHHVGRKSRRHFATPVVVFPTAAGFVIPMTYGRDVDWARNLVDASGGEVERLGRRFSVCNPRIVDGKVALPRLPALVRPALQLADFPGYLLVDLESEGKAHASRARRPKR